MQFFQHSLSSKFAQLSAYISVRNDGSMKFSGDDTNFELIRSNRKKFLTSNGVSLENLVSADLVHANTVEIVSKENGGQFISKTDGLITAEKGLFLSVTVADCLPIVIFHPGKEILCLLHAGWRGLESKIIDKALTTLQNTYDIDPSELLIGIGPAIGSCHYEVNAELAEKFSQYPDAILKRDSKVFLDLKKIAQKQLMELGVQESNIETSDICTYCQSDTYFSHRKDQTDPVQAMMVVVGMK